MSSLHERVRRAMLSSVPADGAAIGNTALRRAIEGLLQAEGLTFGDDDYWQAHAALIAQGVLVKGQGRGGSVRRVPAGTPADFATISLYGHGRVDQAGVLSAVRQLQPFPCKFLRECQV